MKASAFVLCLALSSLGVSFNAAADDDSRHHGHRHHHNYGYNHWGHDDRGYGDDHAVYAKVIDVDPITEVRRTPYARQHCWDERVEQPVHHNAAGSMIIGGVVGGVVGNQIGEGRGKDAATLLGTLMGASIGHDMSERNASNRTVVTQRCRDVTLYDEDERIMAYRVTYRYRGQTFVTRTDYHPGSRIRVDVAPNRGGW